MNKRKNNRDDRLNDHSPRLTPEFSRFAHAISTWAGHPITFLLAVAVVIVWAATGPLFGYSDTWQLVINTGTTIVTFLMVFLIQNTQNRDTLAIQLKLSELVLAMKGAENKFAAIEDLSDDELKALHDDCRARAEMTLSHLEKRKPAPATDRKSRVAAHRAKTSTRSTS
ncbi:MAG TPA: low affinity iron permease family protein [Pseudolabrys sp.]|jgi:low affinity Fe/Cu permease|nr:low affinity iron permease family protein [Pseudolabrys sp.]